MTHHYLKRFGFTLPEVLITLGIIGVVAALTISHFISDYTEKRNISVWKKAYAEFSDIAQQISFDYDVDTFKDAVTKQKEMDNLTLSGYEVTQPVINLFSKYFKNINMACNAPKCEFDGEIMSGTRCARILSDEYNIYTGAGYKYLSGADAGYWILGYYPTVCGETPSYTFALDSNGPFWKISIDVNGKRKPNVIGKDIFVLNMNNLHKVIPGGAEGFYDSQDYACDKDAKYGGPACSVEYLQK